MRLDTEKDGLRAIFKIYEIASLEELLAHKKRTSGQVWDEILKRGTVISRASVIFFLNRLVKAGLVRAETGTGKGGHHKIYSLYAENRNEMRAQIVDKFLYKLWEIFPENESIKDALR